MATDDTYRRGRSSGRHFCGKRMARAALHEIAAKSRSSEEQLLSEYEDYTKYSLAHAAS